MNMATQTDPTFGATLDAANYDLGMLHAMEAFMRGLMEASSVAAMPLAPAAPTLVDQPAASATTWARHEQRSAGGKPATREAKAQREAREQAERLGFSKGRFGRRAA